MSEQQGFPRLDTPFVDENRMLGIPWYQVLITLWNRTGGSQGGGNVPSGAMVQWGGASIPDGYLLCDGTAVSISMFPDLFAAIGFTWGPGDGHTTFNLPDLRDRFIIGAGLTYALADLGGSASTTISVAQLPAHSHTITDPGHTHVQDPHAHGQQVRNSGTAGTSGTQGASAANTDSAGTTDDATATNQDATTGITVDNTGGGDPVSLLPPYAAVYYIIKT